MTASVTMLKITWHKNILKLEKNKIMRGIILTADDHFLTALVHLL